jgi:hypothetical protein
MPSAPPTTYVEVNHPEPPAKPEEEPREAAGDTETQQPPAQDEQKEVRTGKPLVTDGPFAETREHLGG